MSGSGTEVRERSAQVNVRLLPQELAILQMAARTEGVSMAEYLRRAFLARAIS